MHHQHSTSYVRGALDCKNFGSLEGRGLGIDGNILAAAHMSGKRLLDVVAVLQASRAVAAKHLTIRREQIELFVRTSSLTKRFTAIPPQRWRADLGFAQSFTQSATAAKSASNTSDVPIEDGAQGIAREKEQGLQQDHHYARSEDNAATDSKPVEDLDVEQRKARRYPLADGTIPPEGGSVGSDSGLSAEEAMIAQRQSEQQIPARAAEPPVTESSAGEDGPEFAIEQEQDVFYQPPDSASPVLSALPRVKLPKSAEDVQGGDPHIPQSMNADTFYSSTKPSQKAAKEQGSVDEQEEALGQLFHSPRAARMLGLKTKYMPGGRKPSDSRPFSTSKPARKATERGEFQSLAADIAKDNQAQQTVSGS